MPDVKDVYREATQQVRPEPGFVNRQHRKQHRRQRNRKLGAIALTAAIGAVVAILIVRSIDDGTSPRPADEPTRSSGDRLLDLNTGSVVAFPTWTGSVVRTGPYIVSPDGSRVAFVGLGRDGTRQVFVANLGTREASQITDDPRGAIEPSWSPDGSKLVYVDNPRGAGSSELFTADIADGSVEQITFDQADEGSPTFSPDGATILFDAAEGATSEIRSIPVAGGRFSVVVSGAWSDSEPSYSPDGTMISFVRAQPRHTPAITWVMLADADGRHVRAVTHETGKHDQPMWSPDGTRIVYSRDATPYRPGCPCQVMLLEVATGGTTLVGDGEHPTWLNDHTLIIEK